ncbi:MAG: hypothetical protein WCQ86_04470 [Bacteroidaceae bacterium]
MKNIKKKESYAKPEICVISMETEQIIAASLAPTSDKNPGDLGGLGTSTGYFKDPNILNPGE